MDMAAFDKRWIIIGIVIACSVAIIGAAELGIHSFTGSPGQVKFDDTKGIPEIQGTTGTLTLATAFPEAPATAPNYTITSIELVQEGNDKIVMSPKNSIPSAAQAPALAEKALLKYGGLPKDAQLIDAVPRYQAKYNLTTKTTEENYPWMTQVRYIQILNGSPVIGSTINLGLGENGEIDTIVKAWPSYKYNGEVPVISAEQGYEKLQNHNTMRQLQGPLPEGTKIAGITLGYQLSDAWNSEDKSPSIKPVWIYYAVTPFDPESFPLVVDAMKNPSSDGISMEKLDQTTPDITIVSTNWNNSDTNVTNQTSTMSMNRSGNQLIDEESTPVPPVATTPTRV